MTQSEFMAKRIAIAEKYCREKGWSTKPEELTFEQILEIRALQSWKDAGKDDKKINTN